MNKLTICYSTHRQETLGLSAGIMQEHDVIILEEPSHSDFAQVLSGNIKIEEHLLEMDTAYPEFTAGQYRLLQQFSKAGKQILQVEPYLEQLLRIQYFFAEGHSPEEIKPNTVGYSVYCAERDATGMLINYYQEVRGDDFEKILLAMNDFARADAARFVLRDSLRADRILELLVHGKDIYVEAGSIHLLLYKLLAKSLSKAWHLESHSVDRETIKILNRKGNLFSPGDKLTLYYICGRDVGRRKWEKECAQSLIYSKIVKKEEMLGGGERFPHTLNELESIAIVNQLSTETCRILFQRIRSLSSQEAVEVIENYIKNKTAVR